MAFAVQANAPWYKDSLSYTLHVLAQKGQAALPRDLFTTLEEAAGRVQIHECYVHDMFASTNGRPFHPDPMFVYNGYKTALGNLLRVVAQPGGDSPARVQICQQVHGYLHNILTVIHAKGGDQARLLMDPEMSRLLVGLASVL